MEHNQPELINKTLRCIDKQTIKRNSSSNYGSISTQSKFSFGGDGWVCSVDNMEDIMGGHI